MTYLEKYKQDHPNAMLNSFGLPGDRPLCDCPSDYCYEDVSIYEGCPHKDLCCRTCWNREMPEEKEPEKTRYIRIAVDEDTYSDLVNGAETTHIVVKAEDVVESEPVKCNDVPNPDILNITIHTNELENPTEIIADIFKHIPSIKDRMISITIM